MTDRDGRSNDSKTYHTSDFTPKSSLGQHPQSPILTSVTLSETNPPTIANTDSEGDYETSSEGPQSPRPEFHQPGTTFVGSSDGNTIPESNEPLLVSTSLFPDEDSGERNDPSASYTIIGTAESPGIDVTSEIPDCVDRIESASSCSEIQSPVSDLGGFEARRTEYFVAPRIESGANKSESLPVITIATPWGSYEYPDVHMPAERLVSDSQVDMKEKMRLIAACMDGSHSVESRAKFFDDSKQFLCHDVTKDEIKPSGSKVVSSGVYGRPIVPRTPKMITVTSPEVFSEPFNVLPIIRNPDLGSDHMFPPSPSGSSLPITTNNTAVSMTSSFYSHRDGESPRNINPKKSSYDPLSRIEGELAPLQNELSEIRGKVRALNLDYNLSCIDGISKFPNAMNWMNTEDHSSNTQVRPVKDEFFLGDYLYPLQNQNLTFNATNTIGVSTFRGDNQPRYRHPFANRSFFSSAYSYDLEEIEKTVKTEETIAEKSVNHPEASLAEIFSSENCESEVQEISVGSPRSTDRNLSPVYICTSTPSSLSSTKEVASVEGEEETEYCEEKATSPEIRLPDFLDKISIVPISYIGGMPDPPTEPVFSFAQEKKPGFRISHRVLRIEHPDAPPRRRAESAETSSSLSDTVLTLDTETEDSLSARKEADNSSIENSQRPSDRMLVSKFVKRNSCSHFSTSTDGREEAQVRTCIRGLISGPEDFL